MLTWPRNAGNPISEELSNVPVVDRLRRSSAVRISIPRLLNPV